MTLTEIIQADAEYMGDVSVHVVSNMGTVEIVDLNGLQEPIFMQGDDAICFISQSEQLWSKSGEVTISECWLHLAKAYVDCLWN